MSLRFFVTGTDTDVGKTVVSRALLQAFTGHGKSAAGYKPVAVCSQQTVNGLTNKDVTVLQSSSSISLEPEEINPVSLEEEVANAYSGELINYSLLSDGLKTLSERAECIIVEGTGGWRVLMNDLKPFSGWVIQEKLPVILVVGIKAGCINHALLTAQAVIQDGLPLVGWIANRINPCLSHYAETIEALRKTLPAPQLGEIPYLPKAEQRDLSGYLDLSPLLSA